MKSTFYKYTGTYRDSFKELWYSLFLKDPCKECIVRACCSEKCELAIMIDNFIFPHEKINEKKFYAWLLVGSIICSAASFIRMFFM